jgi:hypothetical protein
MAREMPAAVYWIEVAPDLRIRDGIACCSVRSGDLRIDLCATPAVLLESARRALAAYNAFAADKGAAVISLDVGKGKGSTRRH